MIQALVSSIVRDVWAYPEADRQFVYRPVQLTDKRGALGAFVYPQYAMLQMPNNTTRYMVYEIGAVDPKSLGIMGNLWAWKSLTSVVRDSKFIFQMFINHELLPLEGAYIKRTERNSLAVIVPYENNHDLLVSEYNMYFRFYSNSYYSRIGATEVKPSYSSAKVGDPSALSAFLTELSNYDNSGRTRLLMLNNKLITTLGAGSLKTGDVLHCWYDETIIGSGETKLNDLGTYTSDDGQSYYIFQNSFTDAVYYMDDVEFYLIGHMPYSDDSTAIREAGVFIPRFKYNSIKMLSYCDYAINTDYVDAIRNEHPEIDFTQGSIRAYVRKNEHGDVIANDANMQRHFYQLPKETRLALMTGPQAGLSFWNAKNLEVSPYASFMSLNSFDAYQRLSVPENIGKVYNYFGLMEILEQNKIKDNSPWFSVIDANGCVAFYYDSTGALLGHTEFSAGNSTGPIPMPVGGVKVETVAGAIVDPIEYNTYDPLNDSISDINEERYFINPNIHNPDNPNNWERALEGSEYIVLPNNREVQWNIDLNIYTTRKKSANEIILRDRVLYRNTIGNRTRLTYFNTGSLHTYDPGFANVDLWINKIKLVEGKDYALDYPYYTLFNAQYLNPTDNVLTIRLYGLHDSGDEAYPDPEVGFVERGMISRNETFDIYKDVNSRIYVGGRFLNSEEVKSGEYSTGTMPAWVRDGMTYSVEPIVSQTDREFIQTHTEGRVVAYGNISQAEVVLTNLLPQVPSTTPLVVPSLHKLVSPLSVKLLSEIDNGNIMPRLDMPNSEVMLIVSQYSEILDIDPAHDRENDKFCEYLPVGDLLPRIVSPATFSFIEKVSTIYMGGQLQVNIGLQIGV